MLFDIMLWLTVISLLGGLLSIYMFTVHNWNMAGLAVPSGLYLAFGTLMIVIPVYQMYIQDLAKLETHSRAVSVLEARLDRLYAQLAGFPYPDSPLVQVNRDMPVSSITEAITDAENSIKWKTDAYAYAIRDVRATELGLMSGVVKYAGSWDEDTQSIVRD